MSEDSSMMGTATDEERVRAPETLTEFLSALNRLSITDLSDLCQQAASRCNGTMLQFLEKPLNHVKRFHIETDIALLQRSGISKEILAAAVMGIEVASAVDELCDSFGGKRLRERHHDALVSPIPFLNELAKSWDEAANGMPDSIFPSPLLVARGLQRYADLLTWRECIRRITCVSSLIDVAKYSLAGMVKRVTGTYHDREVSAVIAATLGTPDYHMEAHRFWRKRVYARLDRNLPFAALVLQAANSIFVKK